MAQRSRPLSKSPTSPASEWIALARCANVLHLTKLALLVPMEAAD
jgi:hypothetical protein